LDWIIEYYSENIEMIKWYKHSGFLFGGIVYGLSFLFEVKSLDISSFYYQYIYATIRYFYHWTFSFLPFASIYIILPLVIWWMIKYWCQDQYYSSKWHERSRKLLNLAGLWYAFFYILWGYNYQSDTVKDRLGLNEISLDSLAVYDELALVSKELNALRNQNSVDTHALNYIGNIDNYHQSIGTIYNQELPKLGYRAFEHVKVRKLAPSGTLLCISTAGVYIPYTLEGHIDAGLHEIQIPFTLAHEMAHGYGVTDEGECNLLAYLACRLSNDEFLQYSATLSYWKYLMAEARYYNEDVATKAYVSLSTGVKNDLKAIRHKMNQYPDFFPRIRNAIYDYYLRVNGIEKGMASYNEIIEWVIQIKRKDNLVAF
jgi:hypothetical protein